MDWGPGDLYCSFEDRFLYPFQPHGAILLYGCWTTNIQEYGLSTIACVGLPGSFFYFRNATGKCVARSVGR